MAQAEPRLAIRRIALAGNPNAGKSSLFNALTGLNQQVGNYPGVTVDKKTGRMLLPDGQQIEVLDLPGMYSLYPHSADEQIGYELLTNPEHPDHPDLVVVVCDSTNLPRSLVLHTQLYDLGIPAVLALNMVDVADREGIVLRELPVSRVFRAPAVKINARSGQGIEALKAAIAAAAPGLYRPFFDPGPWLPPDLAAAPGSESPYIRFQAFLRTLPPAKRQELQAEEIRIRHDQIRDQVSQAVTRTVPQGPPTRWTRRLDALVTHPVYGYLFFLALMLLVFQAIFSWAQFPMDMIEGAFTGIGDWLGSALPPGLLTDLLTKGIIPGLAGVLVFIPQIAILFGCLAVLEESGYMARAAFIMDRLMRPFGLSGRSVVPLISGMACAVPAVMATRNIDHPADRLITAFVTPLMSCSARLPVYTLLIGLVIPETQLFGFISLQALALLAMYLLGIAAALLSALLMKVLLKSGGKSFFILELPLYKQPRWGNVLLTMWEKVKTFTIEAGKVILAISILLWALGSYGPPGRMDAAEASVPKPEAGADEALQAQYRHAVGSARLEHSFIGIIGRSIEPVIRPLGYDWKIGIALITSFAAREVFVGTMATIYSVGEDAEEGPLLDRMRDERNPHTGGPRYGLATALSLMIFYAFAMQCMSTFAAMYRETRGWKWPVIQLVYMTALAYLGALLTYQLLS